MFEIGSYVIYRAEGVCIIADIRNESFGTIGKQERYYILSPIHDPKSTVFVPVDNQRLVGYMRRLMSAAEITDMINELKDVRMEWAPDSRARSAAFREVLLLGDRRELVVLVNTVSEKLEEIVAGGKKAGSTDTNALKKAEKMLFEEFSATTDISSSDEVVAVLRGKRILGNK